MIVVVGPGQDDLWTLKLWHFDNEGGRDVAREDEEEEVGKGLYCSSVSWQMKRAVICRKHLSPPSSSQVIDAKHISYREKPRQMNSLSVKLADGVTLCTDERCRESHVVPK